MHTNTIVLTSCPDCGHIVHRPLLAPVSHPQLSCRTLILADEVHHDRCGCKNTVHRVQGAGGRHRR